MGILFKIAFSICSSYTLPDMISDAGFNSWDDVQYSIYKELEDLNILDGLGNRNHQWILDGKASDAVSNYEIYTYINLDSGKDESEISISVEIGEKIKSVYTEDFAKFDYKKASKRIVDEFRDRFLQWAPDEQPQDLFEALVSAISNGYSDRDSESSDVVNTIFELSKKISKLSHNDLKWFLSSLRKVPDGDEREALLQEIGMSEDVIMHIADHMEIIKQVVSYSDSIDGVNKSLDDYEEGFVEPDKDHYNSLFNIEKEEIQKLRNSLQSFEDSYRALPRIHQRGVPNSVKQARKKIGLK
jgi:hypothetical protein